MAGLNAYGIKKEDEVKEGADVPIDENIKECIATLNLLDIPTTASCGGHIEKDKNSFPIVQGIIEGNPDGNHSLREKVQTLLSEFNAGRSTPFTLELNPKVTEWFRIKSISDTDIDEEEENEHTKMGSENQYDPERIKTLIQGAQAEFQVFTEFLKQKYFG